MNKNVLLLASLSANFGLGAFYFYNSSTTAERDLSPSSSLYQTSISDSQSPTPPKHLPQPKFPKDISSSLHLDLTTPELMAWAQSQNPSQTLETLKPLSIYYDHHHYTFTKIPLYEQWVNEAPQQALQHFLEKKLSSSYAEHALAKIEASEPGQVETLIRNHPHAQHQSTLIYCWARYLGRKQGIDKALSWAESWNNSKLRNRAFKGAFQGQAQAAPDLAYQKWQDVQTHSNALDWLKTILRVWGQHSPQKATQIALNIPQELWRKDALLSATTAWVYYAPLEALKFKVQHPNYLSKTDHNWVLGAEVYWKESYQLAASLKDEILKSSIITKMARARYPSHPEQAWNALSKHAKYEEHYFLTELFETWAQVSQDKAIDATHTLADNQKHKAIEGIAKGIAQQDLTQALQFAQEHQSKSQLPKTLSSILSLWAEKDLTATLTYIEKKISPDQQKSVLGNFINTFGVEELMENTHFLTYLKESPIKTFYEQKCITAILGKDFELAQSWFNKMEESKEKRELISSFIHTLGRTNPQKAWDWSIALNQEDLTLEAQKKLISNLAYNKPLQAYDFLMQVAPSQEAEFKELYPRVAEYLSKENPVQAYELAQAKVDSSRYGYLFERIFSSWADRDFEKAKEQTLLIEDEKIQQNAQRGLFKALAKSAPQRAIALMKEWDVLDKHLSTFILHWSHQDPQAALEWARLNQELLTKNSYVFKSIYKNWNRNDALGAKEYLANLSEQDQDLFKEKTSSPEPAKDKPFADQAAALANLSTKEKLEKARSFIYNWANKEPQKAYQWLSQQEDEVKKKFTSGILNSWASQDPENLISQIEIDDKLTINSLLSYTLASGLAKKNIERAKNWISDLDAGQNKSSAIQGLTSSWANKSPEEAILWAHDLNPGNDRDNAISSLISSWVNKDQDKAIEWTKSLNSIRDKERTMSHLIRNLTSKDLNKSIELLGEISSSEYRQSALRPIAEHLTQEDPQRAIEWADGFSDAKEREEVIRTSARIWSTKDLDSYKEWLGGLSNTQERNRYVVDAIQSNSYKNIDTAKDLLTFMSEGKQKNDMAKRIISSWGSKEPQEAAEWIQGQESTTLRKQLYEQLMGSWSRFDHRGAAEFVGQLPEEDLKDSRLTKSITQNWSKYEPQEALAWTLELPEGKGKNEAFASWVDTVRKNDPFLASETIAQNSDIEVSSSIYDRMAQDMAKEDLHRTTSWMESLEDDKIKSQVLAGISSHLLEKSPEEAISWAQNRNDEKGMDALLRKWVSKDHLQAAEYMSEHDLANKSALSRLVSTWRYRDQPALEKWLKELPNGEVKSSAIPAYIKNISYRDPKHAKTFLDQTSGESYKKSAPNVFRYMTHKDPSQASEWFDEMARNAPEISSSLLSSLSNSWVRKDKEAALSWGNSLRDDQHQRDYYYSISRGLNINSVEKMNQYLHQVPIGSAQNGFIEQAVRTHHASNKDLSRTFLNYLGDESVRQEFAKKYNL